MTELGSPRIESFISYMSKRVGTELEYLCLDPPGEHEYLFQKEKKSIIFLSGVITGEGIKRTLGSYALRLSSLYPITARLLPMVSETELVVSDELSPDVVIISNRIRLVNLDTNVIYTIDNGRPSRVANEITVRQKLPEDINTPQMYDYDCEYPYFSEKLIQGYRPQSPIDDWEIISDALDQLFHIHKQNVQQVKTEALISDIQSNLKERGLDHDPFLRGIRRITNLEKPKYVYKGNIHGDVHARNVIYTPDATYILDWESYKNDFVFRDLFKPFSISYFDTRNEDFYAEMIEGKNRGGEVYKEYMNKNGSVICSKPKTYSSLPLLYLLLELSRKSRSDLWRSYKKQLTEVLSQTSLE